MTTRAPAVLTNKKPAVGNTKTTGKSSFTHTKKEAAISQLIPPLTARLSDCLFSPPLLTRWVHCLLNKYFGYIISNYDIDIKKTLYYIIYVYDIDYKYYINIYICIRLLMFTLSC